MNETQEKHLPEKEEQKPETLESQNLAEGENIREIIENPAVAPQMVNQAPEDLRGDLFKE